MGYQSHIHLYPGKLHIYPMNSEYTMKTYRPGLHHPDNLSLLSYIIFQQSDVPNIEFSMADLHSNTNKACVESVDFRVHIVPY